MTKEEMKARTKQYALRVIKAVQSLPEDRVANVLGSQLLRSGTSVGANYRAACRAKSTPDFVNKLKIVEEEGDESLFWMELLVESGITTQQRLAALMKEGDEIVSIVVASLKTTRQNN
ncbi:MAG TPA: four helix bundle protein [Verrucomicrobiae bacterium]|nr:four helix bundle protein [Verrucomicrobiae bacterium]